MRPSQAKQLENNHPDFKHQLENWVKCMATGAIYKKKYSQSSIETNLYLIKHFLKHLKQDYSNIVQAYINTKMNTDHLKPKSQVRLYNTVISFVKYLFQVEEIAS